MTSWLLASGLPNRTFSSTVPWNRNTSWRTDATFLRRNSSCKVRTSWLATVTVPDWTSQKRGIKAEIVVLPAPVGPTSATISPGDTSNVTSCRIVASGSYPNVTLSKAMLKSTLWGTSAPGGSTISGFSASSANTRSTLAAAFCRTSLIDASVRKGW